MLRIILRTILAAPFFLAGYAYAAAIDFFDSGVEAAQRRRSTS